jgi:cell division protein FtsZ
MGIGVGSGKSRAREAAIAAISSPLLESSIEGARGVVFNITGGSDLTLHEVNTAAETVYEVVDPNANIIFGAVIDDKMQGEIRITVIATGFSGETQSAPSAIKEVPRNRRPMPPTPNPPTPVVEPRSKQQELDIPEFLQRRRFPKP